MIISPDSPLISYMGRIDFSNSIAPKFFYAGSSMTIKFSGSNLSVKIINHRDYGESSIGAVIDGKQVKADITKDEEQIVLRLAENLDEKEHTAVIFKRQDASHWFEFLQLETDGELLCPPQKPKLKIECFGDSVSAGVCCEAIDFLGKEDPENNECRFSNSWYSYSMITSRLLDAQIHNVAQGGIAILDGTGYFHAPDFIGMQTAYNKLCYFPEGSGFSDWDFSKYTPDIVIFAIGQNDRNNDGNPDNDVSCEPFKSKWKENYKAIILSLMEKYPKANFVLLLTVLMHDESWETAVDEICEEINSPRVERLHFMRSGKATPGHPRIPEQEEMACELTEFIIQKGWNKPND